MDIALCPTKTELESALRAALAGLYDPGALAASPLIGWLGLRDDNDPPAALMVALVGAIESRRPGADAPPHSNAWRVYHILRQRYVECITQRDIAAALSLGARQLRRLHVLAIEVLADYLLAHYHLEAGRPALEAPLPPPVGLPAGQEMEALGATPFEAVDVGEFMQSVLDLLEPLLRSSGAAVETSIAPALPQASLQRVPVRHALLAIATWALRAAGDGRLSVAARAAGGNVALVVTATPRVPATGESQPDDEQLAVARQLLRLSSGDLAVERAHGGEMAATVRLPLAADLPVLIVDDNADALHLFQRFLDGTRYRFAGTGDPQQVVALAEETGARLVVLDLMLPHIDGWEILSRLREHPRTAHVPVLICTILPEEDLARMFGAAGLLRKPVSQPELLAALDRALAQPTESR